MTPYEQLEKQVGDLHKVNRMIQAELSEVSATLVMLVESFNKIMSNQNNMNLRLLSQQEQVDSIEKDLYVRVKALEDRQDPSRHNNLAGVVVLPEGEVPILRPAKVVPIREEHKTITDEENTNYDEEVAPCTDCDECDLSCEEDTHS